MLILSQKNSKAVSSERLCTESSTRFRRPAEVVISSIVLAGVLFPVGAEASVLGILGSTVYADSGKKPSGNLQTMGLLKPAMNINPAPATGGGDVTIVDDSALVPEEGPSGTMADIVKPKNSTISSYIVRPGDTISGIADLFDVSVGTILSANDLPAKTKLQVGQKLIILPVTGLKYTVKKGDTIASLAKRFGGDADEIAAQNGIVDGTVSVGDVIIIPNVEASIAAASTKPVTGKPRSGKVAVGNEPAHDVGPRGDASEIAYYASPLSHYIETQGIHGYNAVDLAAPVGTAIMAAASGDVIVSREGGWNGGYGSYVVIQHDNGSQTLYSHMSKVTAYDGQHVEQGDVIGYVGQTGLATGPHLHFEIRNGIRNPF